MRRTLKILLLLGAVSTQFLFAQLDHIAVVEGKYPDFGAVPGTWGHLQFYRPFGVKGIVLEDWRDLMTLSPVSGEPTNTDRQSWMPLDAEYSLWQQMHPDLVAPEDTIAPSLMVNYKQGDGEFKDFNVWYHNSLGKATRYGWVSKLRSHPRLLGVTPYDEQRHRLQVNTAGECYSLRVEGGYDHQVNPLYWLEYDTTSFSWDYEDSIQIVSDRWDGNLVWDNYDSTSLGTECFAVFQAGNWTWPVGKRLSLNSMAYLVHRFGLGNLSPFEIKVGVVSRQMGTYKKLRHIAEFFLPEINWWQFSATLGLKSLGDYPFFPDLKVQFHQGPITLRYKTLQLIEERVWMPLYETARVQYLSSELQLPQIQVLVGAWQGDGNVQSVQGYHGEMHFALPWQMQISLGAATLTQSQDWVFAKKFLTWELDQDMALFHGALHSHLKLWGTHFFEIQPGKLNASTGLASKSIFPGSDVLHVLNYTISAEVSSMIIGFTDSNLLQDEVWSQYGNVSWNPNITIMANQVPETRFRYLSLIWVFDN